MFIGAAEIFGDPFEFRAVRLAKKAPPGRFYLTQHS
jgi:hypothetical protein